MQLTLMTRLASCSPCGAVRLVRDSSLRQGRAKFSTRKKKQLKWFFFSFFGNKKKSFCLIIIQQIKHTTCDYTTTSLCILTKQKKKSKTIFIVLSLSLSFSWRVARMRAELLSERTSEAVQRIMRLGKWYNIARFYPWGYAAEARVSEISRNRPRQKSTKAHTANMKKKNFSIYISFK